MGLWDWITGKSKLAEITVGFITKMQEKYSETVVSFKNH